MSQVQLFEINIWINIWIFIKKSKFKAIYLQNILMHSHKNLSLKVLCISTLKKKNYSDPDEVLNEWSAA